VLQAAQNVRKRSGARLRTTCSSEPRPATRTAAPSSGDPRRRTGDHRSATPQAETGDVSGLAPPETSTASASRRPGRDLDPRVGTGVSGIGTSARRYYDLRVVPARSAARARAAIRGGGRSGA
jgi:hypothetical protein